MGGLVLLAVGAASDEIDNSFIHFWPPEVPPNEFDGLVLTHVSRYLGVVFRFKDSLYHAFWNPQHTFPIEQPIHGFQRFVPGLSVHPSILLEDSFHCFLIVRVLPSFFLDFLQEPLIPLSCWQ